MKGYCVNCKHFRAKSDIWHGQYCARVENRKVRSHISGEMEYPTGNKYPHARTVNGQGQCDGFEKETPS